MTEREVSSERLPERCPHCDLNWSYHPPAIVSGTDKVRCIECKTVFVPSVSSERVSEERLKLWFFRDLSSEQRLKLFGLLGMPVEEIGDIHGHQTKAFRHMLLALRSSVKTPGPDSETYYTKGKDGSYWEGLPDAEFARELSYACQDLNDTGLGDDLDKWMPFQVMLGDAANRITRILSAIEAPAAEREEGEPAAYGVYLTDGRFMDIASDSREDAEEMALIHYEEDQFTIRALYTRPSPGAPSEVTEE